MAARGGERSQDLRVQRTYKMLKDAFGRLIEKKSFEQITVLAICEEAMVRRTTFYQHFEDKYDFLSWFIREKQREYVDRVMAEGGPRELRDYYGWAIRSVMRYLRENDALVKNLVRFGVRERSVMEAFERGCVAEVAEFLSRNYPQGAQTRVPISCLAEFYTGGMIAAARWWFSQGECYTDEEMAEFISRMIAADVLEPGGVAGGAAPVSD